MDQQEILRRIEAIRSDVERGATQLAEEAVRLLADLADDRSTPDDQFARLFPAVARELAQTRPSMASLLNAVGRVVAAWREARGAAGGGKARAEVSEAVRGWVSVHERAVQLIAGHLASDLCGSVITLSYSSTVIHALEECWNRGLLTGAIVAESRPRFEGRRTAERLASLGIPTVLITDAQMGIFVSGVTAAVVGADTLLPSGYLVNKVGTNLLALAAHRSHVPLYVLAETHKILPGPSRKAPFSLEEKDPNQVLADPPSGVAVRNVLFDVTPARFITDYVTENGFLNRREIAALSRAAPGRILGLAGHTRGTRYGLQQG